MDFRGNALKECVSGIEATNDKIIEEYNVNWDDCIHDSFIDYINICKKKN